MAHGQTARVLSHRVFQYQDPDTLHALLADKALSYSIFQYLKAMSADFILCGHNSGAHMDRSNARLPFRPGAACINHLISGCRKLARPARSQPGNRPLRQSHQICWNNASPNSENPGSDVSHAIGNDADADALHEDASDISHAIGNLAEPLYRCCAILSGVGSGDKICHTANRRNAVPLSRH